MRKGRRSGQADVSKKELESSKIARIGPPVNHLGWRNDLSAALHHLRAD